MELTQRVTIASVCRLLLLAIIAWWLTLRPPMVSASFPRLTVDCRPKRITKSQLLSHILKEDSLLSFSAVHGITRGSLTVWLVWRYRHHSISADINWKWEFWPHAFRKKNLVERGSSVVECRTRNQVSPDSNPPLLPFRRLGIFVLSIDAPVDSAEYLAIHSGGNVSDLVFARNCSIARMLPGELDTT